MEKEDQVPGQTTTLNLDIELSQGTGLAEDLQYKSFVSTKVIHLRKRLGNYHPVSCSVITSIATWIYEVRLRSQFNETT
ncbi:hypothetical protein K0M31_015379 [Melipona bicolor]|uniref:Uncharacterized protein n=1 Tax=Melipona bicolor TaxID=60889 RepID=A0AA40FFJ5_9HYME|nr:hypothetical protein K0M31_015379 [Melipona bicolor]